VAGDNNDDHAKRLENGLCLQGQEVGAGLRALGRWIHRGVFLLALAWVFDTIMDAIWCWSVVK
jgi:hypothetical protein